MTKEREVRAVFGIGRFGGRCSVQSITYKTRKRVLQAEGLKQASPGQSESASVALGFDPLKLSPKGAKQIPFRFVVCCDAHFGAEAVFAHNPRASLVPRFALGWLGAGPLALKKPARKIRIIPDRAALSAIAS